jgi:hypothetical protein
MHQKFYTHILRLSVSIMVFTIYGKHSPSYDSAVVQQVHDYTRTYFGVIGPGALPPVDFLPILQLVPERWATWKTKCKQVREMQRKLFYGLFEECESRMSRGHLVGCYMEDVIPRKDELGFTDRDMLVYVIGMKLGSLVHLRPDTTLGSSWMVERTHLLPLSDRWFSCL